LSLYNSGNTKDKMMAKYYIGGHTVYGPTSEQRSEIAKYKNRRMRKRIKRMNEDNAEFQKKVDDYWKNEYGKTTLIKSGKNTQDKE